MNYTLTIEFSNGASVKRESDNLPHLINVAGELTWWSRFTVQRISIVEDKEEVWLAYEDYEDHWVTWKSVFNLDELMNNLDVIDDAIYYLRSTENV